MRTHHTPVLLACLSLSALAACGPAPDPDNNHGIPEQASYCATDFEDDFPETRQMEIGYGPPAAFLPYADGDDLDRITGNQGLEMITPVVRVDSAPGDEDETCYRVLLQESTSDFSSQFSVTFYKDGDDMLSDGTLYYPIASTGEVQITATVYGKGFSASHTVTVTLY